MKFEGSWNSDNLLFVSTFVLFIHAQPWHNIHALYTTSEYTKDSTYMYMYQCVCVKLIISIVRFFYVIHIA